MAITTRPAQHTPDIGRGRGKKRVSWAAHEVLRLMPVVAGTMATYQPQATRKLWQALIWRCQCHRRKSIRE